MSDKATGIDFADGDGTTVSKAMVGTKAVYTVDSTEPDAAAHIADTTDAHDASAVSIADAGGYYTGTQVEAALQELGAFTGIGGVVSFALLADTELSGTASSFDFTSIPGTYKHLMLFISGRTDRASPATVDQVSIRFNNDSSAIYDAMQLTASNATAVAAAETYAATSARVVGITATDALSGRNGSGVVFIPDYADTTFHKHAHGLSGSVENTTANNQHLGWFMASWRSTAAITRITLISPNGATSQIGSRATLYGLG